MSTSYEITASRKRPHNFSSIRGQDYVVTTLLNSLKTGKIAHAYLFSGERGVGKTSTARIFARALNCPDPTLLGTDEGLNYPGAEDISRGVSLDVIEIDGASNTGVSDVRTIREEILFPPQNFRYKIYIIDEVHMLSNSAFNALLKTIEEPPPYIVFIFATTEVHKLPATIRSRCQQFHFRLIAPNEILHALTRACQEADPPVEAEEEALNWIVREARGSMRDAYTILDQVIAFSNRHINYAKIKEVLGVLGVDEIKTLLRLCIAEDFNELAVYVQELLNSSATVDQLIVSLSDFFRCLLFIKQGVTSSVVLNHSAESIGAEFIDAYTISQIEKVLELLLQAYRDIRYTLNTRLEFEVIVSKIARVRQYFDHEDILARVEDLHTKFVLGTQTVNEDEAIQIEEITQAMWQALIHDLEQSKPKVAALLQGIDSWSYNSGNDSLVIYNDKRMILDMLKENAQFIAGHILQLFNVRVTISAEQTKTTLNETTVESEVEKVRQIFNGEVVS